jgi:hypothetical protein
VSLRLKSTRAKKNRAAPPHSQANNSNNGSGVFPTMVKSAPKQGWNDDVDVIGQERKRHHRLKLSHWESLYFKHLTMDKLNKELTRLSGGHAPGGKELVDAMGIVEQLRQAPNSYIGNSSYANVLRDVADWSTRPWSSEQHRLVREGGRQLRRQVWNSRLANALVNAIVVGFIWCAPELPLDAC